MFEDLLEKKWFVVFAYFKEIVNFYKLTIFLEKTKSITNMLNMKYETVAELQCNMYALLP